MCVEVEARESEVSIIFACFKGLVLGHIAGLQQCLSESIRRSRYCVQSQGSRAGRRTSTVTRRYDWPIYRPGDDRFQMSTSHPSVRQESCNGSIQKHAAGVSSPGALGPWAITSRGRKGDPVIGLLAGASYTSLRSLHV